jgi:hypothetical protein
VRSTAADGFARLQDAGVHTVRWWLFPGDPWEINHDAAGAPVSLNPAVFTDVDAALALADQFDLTYDFVLFSSPTAAPSSWLTDASQRQRLADALAPMFQRYGNNPRIVAWEMFNEPEWDIWNSKIAAEPVQATVKLLADTVHSRGGTRVTVGAASIDGLPLWVGQHLDFYSPHWYDPMTSSNCARCTDATSVRSKYGLDGLPIVIGEFYAGPDTDALRRFEDFRAKGYAGAWAWSLFSDHTNDKLRIDLGAAKAFTSKPVALVQPVIAAPSPAVSTGDIQLLANWISPTFVSVGQEITFNQDVQSKKNATVRLEVNVVDDQDRTVSTTVLNNQPLSSDALNSLTASFKAQLAPGRYDVQAALLTADGDVTLAISDQVGTFVVDAPPEPTPAPATATPAESPADSPESAG